MTIFTELLGANYSLQPTTKAFFLNKCTNKNELKIGMTTKKMRKPYCENVLREKQASDN